MSSKASVEIWHDILKYSISVPLFFDSDPVATYGIDILQEYTYESPYWQSERVRNSLRRVSRSWDEFLKPYAHRFIRLDDVLHNKVPVSALPAALRLDLDSRAGCHPETCHPAAAGYWMEMTGMWKAASFSEPRDADEAQQSINWKVEIVKGWNMYEAEHILILKRRAPALRALIFQPVSSFPPVEELPPNLKLLLTEINEARSHFDIIGTASITTLQITLASLSSIIEAHACPCLRHLSITFENIEDPSQETLCKFLRSIGPQLQTFHFHYPLVAIPMEQILWDILPIVQSIQLPYMWCDSGIPAHHPLQRVQISVLEMVQGAPPSGEEIIAYLPLSTRHKLSIKMDTTWFEVLSAQQNLTIWLTEYYGKHCTSFKDAHGDTFSRYIVFLITAFWKQPNRRYRKCSVSCEGPFLPF